MADWDRILASAPLNAEAARVTGESREPVGFRRVQSDQNAQDGPHLLRPLPDAPDFINLTGQRFGRLYVRGLAEGFSKASSGSAWAVRCDCGCYTMRRSGSLRRGLAVSCNECHRAEQVRLGKSAPIIDRSNVVRGSDDG